MTRLAAVFALVMILPLAACNAATQGGGAGEGASCAAPAISAKPFRVRPAPGPVQVHAGQRLTVYGRFFASACNDTGQGGPTRPIAHLLLAFASRYRTLPLATVHPHGPESSFRVTIRIPPTTPTGPAKVFETAQDHEIRLVVGR